jgi:hypothetical protein
MNPERIFAASVVGNAVLQDRQPVTTLLREQLPKLQPEIRERVDVVLAKKEAAQ